MTFAEFVKQAHAVRPDISCDARAGCFRHQLGSGEQTVLTFSIWDAGMSCHFDGRTPEEALAKYRLAATPAPEQSEITEQLGELTCA